MPQPEPNTEKHREGPTVRAPVGGHFPATGGGGVTAGQCGSPAEVSFDSLKAQRGACHSLSQKRLPRHQRGPEDHRKGLRITTLLVRSRVLEGAAPVFMKNVGCTSVSLQRLWLQY